MADTKISALSAATALTGAEQVPVVQGGATVRTTVAAFSAVVGAMVVRAAAYNIPNGAGTDIPWDTEVYDTGGLWAAGSPARFTIPSGEGGLFTVGYGIATSADATYRWITGILKNGGSDYVPGSRRDTGGTTAIGTGATVDMVLADGDYVTAQAFQSSGAVRALMTAQSAFWIRRIGDTP